MTRIDIYNRNKKIINDYNEFVSKHPLNGKTRQSRKYIFDLLSIHYKLNYQFIKAICIGYYKQRNNDNFLLGKTIIKTDEILRKYKEERRQNIIKEAITSINNEDYANCKKIADKFNVSTERVRQLCIKNNIILSDLKKTKRNERFEKIKNNIEFYFNNGRINHQDLADIAFFNRHSDIKYSELRKQYNKQRFENKYKQIIIEFAKKGETIRSIKKLSNLPQHIISKVLIDEKLNKKITNNDKVKRDRKIIDMYFSEKKTINHIAKEFNYTFSNISYIIRKYKKKLTEII